jgi:hypothetical protein
VKKFATALAVASMALMGATAASADNSASFCGAAHGAFANVNGNFDFLGQAGGTPGYHNGAVGQEAGANGSNNSNACGNPQP